MRLSLLTPMAAACALAACSPPAAENAADNQVASVNDTEVMPEETGAPSDADTGTAAPAPTPTPTPTPASTPPGPGEPGGLPDDGTPVDESSSGPFSAQAAATVVERYYGLIEAGKYHQAWSLWGNGGRDSGMSSRDFAASFARYSEYHANVGAPGRIDPGAGQRYVTVPVQVYGRLKQGNRPFNMRGSVTLHRTVVDGASAAQRNWHIRSTDINPRPGEATPTPTPQPTEDNRSSARYRCMDGSRLNARFDPDNRRVTLRSGGSRIATLSRQRTGSGIAYAGGGYEFSGQGDRMTYKAPGKPPLACTVIR